jgi:hypothetical protein
VSQMINFEPNSELLSRYDCSGLLVLRNDYGSKPIYYNGREKMSYPHWFLSCYGNAFNQLDRYRSVKLRPIWCDVKSSGIDRIEVSIK